MSKRKGFRWKHSAIVLALFLGSGGLAASALAGAGAGADPGGTAGASGTARSTAAAPAPSGSPSPAPGSASANASSADRAGAKAAQPAPPPPSPAVLAELDELKRTVQAQAQSIADRTQELQSEQATLASDLERIARLEAAMGVVPNGAPNAAPNAEPNAELNAELSSPSSSPASSISSVPAVSTIAAATPVAFSSSLPTSPAPSSSSASAIPAAQPQEGQTTGNVDKRLSNLEDRLKKVGPLSFSGDFRFRDESFSGGPTNGSLDQDRLRIRLRFNTDIDLGNGLTGGFSLATGDVNNPISTNTDITAFYVRKPIELDKAFAQYTPTFFNHLTVVGGKFAYPWFNTELTWDKDLNPEGAAETLAFNLNNTPVLKRIAFIGFELPFSQVSGVNLNNQSLIQSVTYGGQVQGVFQLTPWATFSAFEGFYDFRNADPIALALAKANSKNPVTPFTGVLPLSAGSTTQNSIVTTTATSIVTVGGTTAPTGVTTVSNAQFLSKFSLYDSIAKLDFKTPYQRWPISFIGDFVDNTGACANANNILKAPVNTSTATYSQSTNFACDADQRYGYWAEVEVGRIVAKHDLQFGYTRIVIEREAVLSNFDYSEIRQGANVSEHRATVFYTVKNNVVLDFIALIGRPLNQSLPKPAEPFLDRLQFDVNYTF